jgi:hypothetical protein
MLLKPKIFVSRKNFSHMFSKMCWSNRQTKSTPEHYPCTWKFGLGILGEMKHPHDPENASKNLSFFRCPSSRAQSTTVDYTMLGEASSISHTALLPRGERSDFPPAIHHMKFHYSGTLLECVTTIRKETLI